MSILPNLITINGVHYTPSSYTVSIMDIDQDSVRTADGTMQRNRVATKRKIELTYKGLDKAEIALLLNALSALFLEVKYIDPIDNDLRTGTFYSGDKKVEGMDYIDGVIRWKNVSFNLVEK